MITTKLIEVLEHPADGALSIVTQGPKEPHIANTWNSYVQVADDHRLLIPAGRMTTTEKNITENPRVKLSIASREVQGQRYKGTGFLVTGIAKFIMDGPDYAMMKEKFPWLRAVLEVTVTSAEQTL